MRLPGQDASHRINSGFSKSRIPRALRQLLATFPTIRDDSFPRHYPELNIVAPLISDTSLDKITIGADCPRY